MPVLDSAIAPITLLMLVICAGAARSLFPDNRQRFV